MRLIGINGLQLPEALSENHNLNHLPQTDSEEDSEAHRKQKEERKEKTTQVKQPIHVHI